MIARAIACIAAFAAVATHAAPPAQPVVTQRLECRADEAGWEFAATRSMAQFTTATPRKREVVYRGSLQVVAPASVVWRGDSTHLPRETAVLVAREEACKGGTHKAMLSIRQGEASPGCCVVRAGFDARVAPVANLAAKPAGDWSRALADLLPAIAACAGRDAPRTVTGASMPTPGVVRVSLVQAGAAIECTVDASGRGAPALVKVATPSASPGPWLYPLREPPPVVACGRLERVQVRGKDVGYLHYEPC